VANRNANNNGWLNGNCYLLEWSPVATGNDNNDNCRCWVRDPVSGRERRAPLGEDAADVVVVGDSNTLRGRNY
jgi:hypothetical protein